MWFSSCRYMWCMGLLKLNLVFTLLKLSTVTSVVSPFAENGRNYWFQRSCVVTLYVMHSHAGVWERGKIFGGYRGRSILLVHTYLCGNPIRYAFPCGNVGTKKNIWRVKGAVHFTGSHAPAW